MAVTQAFFSRARENTVGIGISGNYTNGVFFPSEPDSLSPCLIGMVTVQPLHRRSIALGQGRMTGVKAVSFLFRAWAWTGVEHPSQWVRSGSVALFAIAYRRREVYLDRLS